MENYLIIGVVALILILAALYIIKEKKKGKKCIGCPEGGCSKNGSSCCNCGKK